MDEIVAHSQPEEPQAEMEPDRTDEIIVPELVGVGLSLAPFTKEQLAEEVAESHIKVIWRGGIKVSTMLAVMMSLVMNTGMAIVAYYLLTYSWSWTKDAAPQRQHQVFGANVAQQEKLIDGGSPGSVGLPNAVEQGPVAQDKPMDRVLGEVSNGELLASVEQGSESPFDAGDATVKRPDISRGPGGLPRLGKGSPGGGSSVRGTHGSNGIGNSGTGDGGEGGGHGTGKGIGNIGGLSMDTEVRLLGGPPLRLPPAYVSGTAKVERAPVFRVWVLPNDQVDAVELVTSSGDPVFDMLIKEHYSKQNYLAATIDGEPVRKSKEVSFNIGSGS